MFRKSSVRDFENVKGDPICFKEEESCYLSDWERARSQAIGGSSACRAGTAIAVAPSKNFTGIYAAVGTDEVDTVRPSPVHLWGIHIPSSRARV